MLKDSDIRDELCLFLEEAYGKVRFFEELVIGKSRADIVMVTEEDLIGIEIKSDADTYTRLPGQIKDYDRFFDYNILACGSSHGQHAAEHVPAHWGIITIEEGPDCLDFYVLRKPQRSSKVKLKNQVRLLWRRELANIQAKNGLHKYARKTRAQVEKYVMESVGNDAI
ncbi:MAG: sce7726 family protein [Lachnospiraceae bacterium]|nr:sce7726 family protein [Lachnospiraceae bacterium]